MKAEVAAHSFSWMVGIVREKATPAVDENMDRGRAGRKGSKGDHGYFEQR